MSNSNTSYNLLTKWLHIGLVISVTVPLIFSLFMNPMADKLGLPLIAFNLHKFIGLNALLLISLYLLWAKEKKAKSLSELFPWFSGKRLVALFREIGGLLSTRRINGETKCIAAAIQGLGLGTSLVATATGLYLILGIIFPVLLTKIELVMILIHKYSSNALWGYLVLHVGALSLHVRIVHNRTMLQIFDLLERRNDLKPKVVEISYKSDSHGTQILHTNYKNVDHG